MIEKILLVQPPYTIHKADPKGCQPPLGLAYIAAVLEESEFDVEILDAIVEGFDQEERIEKDFIRYGLSFDDIKKKVQAYSPDLIGISCLFSSQQDNALGIARVLKEAFPTTTIVMGGAHPSAAYEDILRNDFVDYVIIGEGDYSFRDLIYALNRDSSLTNIDGLAYRKNGAGVTAQLKERYIEDLDKLPFPARHLLPMDKYFAVNRPHGTMSKMSPNTSIVTSRGCPAKCIFCSIHTVWGRKFRARSPENIMDEIKSLVSEYGIKELHFEDDNLTFDKKRAKRFFTMLSQQSFKLLWTTPNGIAAYSIDDELIDLMKKSGCYRVCLAVESGDEYVLQKIIRKPLKLKTIKPITERFRKAGISVDAFFVLGFPGETRDKMKKTFKFASEVRFDNVNFSIATPYPGTELYRVCKQENYLANDFSFEKLKVSNANISTPEFTENELERLVAIETFKFRLKQLRSPSIFYERVVKRFFVDPRFFVNYLKRLLTRIASS